MRVFASWETRPASFVPACRRTFKPTDGRRSAARIEIKSRLKRPQKALRKLAATSLGQLTMNSAAGRGHTADEATPGIYHAQCGCRLARFFPLRGSFVFIVFKPKTESGCLAILPVREHHHPTKSLMLRLLRSHKNY
jgi:hypothetical protein